MEHLLGNRTNLSKYRDLEIIPCILSLCNELGLPVNSKSSHTNLWTLKQHARGRWMGLWRNQKENLNIPGNKQKTKKHCIPKSIGHNGSSHRSLYL